MSGSGDMYHHHQPFPPALSLAAADSSFQGDEGYSEETRSQEDGDSNMGIEPGRNAASAQLSSLLALQDAIMGLNECQRAEHAYAVLRTLRTSSIAAIVERLTPLLHLDPVVKLPPDITSMIFSYLSPAALAEASLVSKAWRERTLDSSLWREKFRSEGWVLDMAEIRKYEESQKTQSHVQLHKTLSRKASSPDEERRQKRRARNAEILRNRERSGLGSGAAAAVRDSIPDVLSTFVAQDEAEDEEMRDVETQTTNTAAADPLQSVDGVQAADRMDTEESSRSPDTPSLQSLAIGTEPRSMEHSSVRGTEYPVKDPPLMLQGYSGSPRVNFHHVYRQKRRLEENWAQGRYKSFQLPHRDHPEEAHSECVYTIQYAGNILVSGSRDKTLRIWNLDTQRLAQRPLTGHNGSVLCLQFDASPEEDLIVSGSSDTDVCLWQFSTGVMIRRLHQAHRESVLNLKFDHRFLVTCSKDKMIKIWNRKELKPGDEDYPRKGLPGGGKCPSYILDLVQIPDPLEVERLLSKKAIEVVPEYSIIMKIDSHGAAVNAVHIYKDQLVSASGDRALRVFDIHSGVCTAFCKGHTKGIACVQYDGKRIVSGSSDDTIRIFDPISQAEVACLQGHSKLVRTVQAAFGDAPGAEEDLRKQALDSDMSFFRSMSSDRVSSGSVSSRRTAREGGPLAHRPRVTALGAKLPPGGGGSPWARIVSGSYDETVIIWKKAPDGHWVVGHTLRQADALLAAGGPLVSRADRNNPMLYPLNNSQPILTGLRRPGAPPTTDATTTVTHILPSHPLAGQNGGSSAGSMQAGGVVAITTQAPYTASPMLTASPPAVEAAASSSRTHSESVSDHATQGSSSASSSPSSTVAVLGGPHTLSQQRRRPNPNIHPALQTSNSPSGSLTSAVTHPVPTGLGIVNGVMSGANSGASSLQVQTQSQTQSQASSHDAAPAQQQHQHHHPQYLHMSAQQLQHQIQHRQLQIQQHHQQLSLAQQQQHQQQLQNNGQQNPQQQQPNARVFKLQFDARRIICCSQDPKIVGWDFANGDEEIIECSKFFGAPQ